VQSQVLQQALRRLEQAFVSMWEQGHGFPRFKKSGTMRSFVFPQVGIDAVRDGAIKLPVIGWIEFRQSRSIPDGAKLKQVRIVRRARACFQTRCILENRRSQALNAHEPRRLK